MKYYICELIFRDENYYVLWFGNDQNGVFSDNGKIVYSHSLHPIIRYGEIKSIRIDGDSITRYDSIDFTDVESWIDNPTFTINSEYLLNIWNMLVDISTSTEIASVFLDIAEEEAGITIYNKLFWGANLPDYTPPGKVHIPDWLVGDIAHLQEILNTGLEELDKILLNGIEVQ